MKARIRQIRKKDRVILFNFFDDAGKNVGSRGYKLSKEAWEKIPPVLKQLLDFVPIKDVPETGLEKLAKRAYDEWIRAKEEEEAGEVEIG